MAHTGSYVAHAPVPPGPGVPQEPGRPADAPSRRHDRAFAAVPDQVRQARKFLADVLGDSPAADDAVLCLSELASNAITHSNSRNPGGQFTVQVSVSHERLRVEVHDDGGTWTPRPASDATSGRGLRILSQLARDWGRAGHRQTGWNVWFEIDYPQQTNLQTQEETTSTRSQHPTA